MNIGDENYADELSTGYNGAGKKILVFSKLRKQLLDALNEKLAKGELPFMEEIGLLYGFVEQRVSSTYGGDPVVYGGPSIPMIMLLGKKSGRIYYLALKAILPDIEV
jgi:hypothetical protein